MPELLIYLFKANLALVLFYLGYRVLLRKLTFYHLNRIYLLFAWGFSLGYPGLDVGAWLARRPEVPVEPLSMVVDWEQLPPGTFGWWPYAMAVFWVGVAWFAGRLVIRLGSLWRLHRESRQATWRMFRFRQIFGQVAPFSFWRSIYLNQHQHRDEELLEIFRHEQVHVDGLHTADVLVAEVCSAFCWFNPGAWLMRHAVRENLEFITDRRVLQSGADRQAYQYSLLQVGQHVCSQRSIGNGFSIKHLKRRIMMMNKRKSAAVNLGRYLLAVPVIAVFVLVFTVSRAHEHDRRESLSSPSLDGPSGGAVEGKVDTAAVRPLILVDGEVYDGDIAELDANAIERIDVLKDKAAIERYGDQGNGGVVLVTSKTDQKASVDKIKKDTRPAYTGKRSVTIRSYGARSTLGVAADSVLVLGVKTLDGVLIVIDGEEQSAATLQGLPPDEIDAVRVWKDALATEKYAEKGRKGVIEITTKKKTY